MVFIYNNTGTIIGRSKNLRGIHERCRRVAVALVEVLPKMDGGANVIVKWIDNSWFATDFADYGIAVDWAGEKRFRGAKKMIALKITLKATTD